MNADRLGEGLERWQRRVERRRGAAQILAERDRRAQEALAGLEEEGRLLERVRILLGETADYARESARQQLEYTVTQALQFVFGQEMAFRVEIEEKAGQPSAEFLVESPYEGGDRLLNRPQDARGGGVVDVVSLALRVALLQLCEPALPGPLLLDEPGKHVSAEYSLRVAEFLKEVSTVFGRQVILVTHDQALAGAADRSFLVELRQGRSRVTPLGREEEGTDGQP